MCGIVGFSGTRQAAPVLIDGLRRLEYRGYDSAGVAVADGENINMAKVKGYVKNLSDMTHGGADIRGLVGVGHTRWATHGAPNDINAHPHLSSDGRFAVVHNGIIENYAALRAELTANGYTFLSDTDTEVVAHLLEMYYDGDAKRTFMRAASRLEGSYSLGILCADGRLFAVREQSPLILGLGVGENYFASDVAALVPHTKNVIYLDDGEFAELTPENVTVYDVRGREIEKPVSRVTWDVEAAEKGGYEPFMLKEIMEQPACFRATVEPRIKNDRIEFENFDLTDQELRGIRRVVITACGSAGYAGQVGRYVIEELCRIPVSVELASELRYRNPIIDGHTLLIVISQSGETADTIAALRECKARGARVLAIVNVVGSTIAKLADHVIYTWAGPEIAVATTKGYTTQVAVLDMLAIYLADRLGLMEKPRYEELIGALHDMPGKLQRAIDLNRNLKKLAKTFSGCSDIYFIGRNLDYAVSMEGALKLKEISYIFAEAYAAGELKHGTIALLEQGSLVVTLACYEPLFDKTMSNIEEVKARGAEVLAVALEDNKKIISKADYFLKVPRTDPILNPIAQVIPLQLFAYYIAKERGCDIDKPKNLAKSVTVE